MRNAFLICLFISQILSAQQVVAPTPAAVGSSRGQNVEDYNVVNSFELGYRFALIDGDQGAYRSQVNYGNGIRLLGSSLTVNSRDGHGRFFDEIVLNTIGLGNDPYEAARLRIQKNKLYDYNMLWRANDYFNPALPIADGQHFRDTRLVLQDHDLTLLPQAKFRVRFGYTRNTQSGPALTTFQLFDTRSAALPFFADIRRNFNEYRLGADITVAGVKLTVMHRWEYFKEDTPNSLLGVTRSPIDQTTVTQFHRAEPDHGSSPAWLANLNANKKRWAANGRFTYTGARRAFILDELAGGIDRFGQNRNRQVLVRGDARRPLSAGDLSLTFNPGDRLTIVNNTSFYNNRIDGDARYLEFNSAVNTFDILNFQFLGIRTIANATDLHFRVSPWVSLYGGYGYSTRRIRTVENFALPPDPPGTPQRYEQENHQNTGLFGVRLKPVQPLTVRLDAEIGRTNRTLTPVADRDYHALGGRVDYRVKKLVFSTAYRQMYNNNSVTLSSFSSRSRNYTASATWTPRDSFSLDASYSKLHLDTVGGIAFFAALPRPTLVQGRDSVYVSNIHSGNLGARFVVAKRVDLYIGYTITKDTGDGRPTAVPAGTTDPIALVFVPVQTFPLTFQSPLARVSVRITPKIRWNVGWQFYRYREEFGVMSYLERYRAHTGYTSILWSF
jgi:hypothetical protein